MHALFRATGVEPVTGSFSVILNDGLFMGQNGYTLVTLRSGFGAIDLVVIHLLGRAKG